MEILESLKFVRGAVSKKDLVPEMKHLRLEGGMVRAFNGVLTICCPIELQLDCTPRAGDMIAAIGRCQEITTLSMTDSGRLRVQSGAFRAFIECLDAETMPGEPAGQMIQIDGEALVKAFRALSPFVGNDASRPWVNGILLRGQSAFATNNVCLAEYWIGTHTPFMANIPSAAIEEVLRIGEPPEYVQVDEHHSITFHYGPGRWVKTALLSIDWPELTKILDIPDAQYAPIPEDLFVALDMLKPFLTKENLVFISDGLVSSDPSEGVGASYRVDGFPDGCYRASMLQLLQGAATVADFTRYPKPCPFMGERLRGVILGMRR